LLKYEKLKEGDELMNSEEIGKSGAGCERGSWHNRDGNRRRLLRP